jgi:hypothetical protein
MVFSPLVLPLILSFDNWHADVQIQINDQLVHLRFNRSLSTVDVANAMCYLKLGYGLGYGGVCSDALVNQIQTAQRREGQPVVDVTIDGRSRIQPLPLQMNDATGFRVSHSICQSIRSSRAMQMIQFKYMQAKQEKSDINEHVETLSRYGSQVRAITDVGVRTAVGTVGFLHGLLSNRINSANPEGESSTAGLSYTMYDLQLALPPLDIQCLGFATGVDASFFRGNILEQEIQPTDLLFIDTFHAYGQLKRELGLMARKTRQWVSTHQQPTSNT